MHFANLTLISPWRAAGIFCFAWPPKCSIIIELVAKPQVLDIVRPAETCGKDTSGSLNYDEVNPDNPIPAELIYRNPEAHTH
jgi:hypothetical protein